MKPFCSQGDLQQAKKWVWKLDRAREGGYWLCWEHFNAAVNAGTIVKDGNNYSDV